MAEDNCKRELINICCKYLSNAWKEVKFDEITCKELSGGFANRTYYCSIKSSQIPEKYLNVEPKEVVIHLNGAGICGSIHSLGYKTIGEVALNVAIEILSRINMAPKLYVVFEGGRIEEYVPSRICSVDDFKSIDLCKALIRKLAKIHSMQMPIPKIPDIMDALPTVKKDETKDFSNSFSPEDYACVKDIIDFPAEQELEWLSRILPRISHKPVFSHLDLHVNNILLKQKFETIDESLMIIDYELCHYYYRGFDIAFFLRMTYTRISGENGKINVHEETFGRPGKDEILQEYLNEITKLNKSSDPDYDNFDHLKMEVDVGDLIACVSLISSFRSILYLSQDIPLKYGSKLARDYFELKSLILNDYGDKLNTN